MKTITFRFTSEKAKEIYRFGFPRVDYDSNGYFFTLHAIECYNSPPSGHKMLIKTGIRGVKN